MSYGEKKLLKILYSDSVALFLRICIKEFTLNNENICAQKMVVIGIRTHL